MDGSECGPVDHSTVTSHQYSLTVILRNINSRSLLMRKVSLGGDPGHPGTDNVIHHPSGGADTTYTEM